MTEPVRIPDPVAEAARRWEDFPAVVSPQRTLTYGVLDRLVAGTARRLQASGVADGLRVGVCLPNTWEAVVVLLAVIRAGGVACLLSTRTPPGGLAALLGVVQASVLVGEDPAALLAAEGVRMVTPDAVVEDGAPWAAADVSPHHPATVVFTSGSGAAPRAALHSLGNHVFSARGSNANIALAPGDRWLLALPLFHVGGLGVLFRCLLAGAAVVVPPPGLAVGEAAARYRVTHVSLVATQLRRLLHEPPAGGGMKAILVGGSAVPFSLLREAHAQGWPVHTTYGLTEMSSQVTTTPPGAAPGRLATSGRVLPHRALRIVAGEILVRGPTLFLGYLAGEAVHRPLDADGWFHTRDLGRLDADGFLHVEGRADNLFISGGENIQPEEIEQALCGIEGVVEAVVVPVPDVEFGQRPVAFVRCLDGAPPLALLAARLQPVLPRFKIPGVFYEWPADVLQPGLKHSRASFQERALARQSEKR